jgi:hypothetical protein
MPIEIKELVIRTVVGDARGAADSRAEESSGAAADTSSTDEIVHECVRQVLRVLSQDKER